MLAVKPFIARSPLSLPLLSGAQRTEVLCRFGDRLVVKLEGDAAQILLAHLHVEEALRPLALIDDCKPLLLLVEGFFKSVAEHRFFLLLRGRHVGLDVRVFATDVLVLSKSGLGVGYSLRQIE